MKNFWSIPVAVILLFAAACSPTPVIRKDLMKAGNTEAPLTEMRKTPASFKGRLFILGGQIIKTEATGTGSLLIEAVYVPVDSKGRVVKKSDNSKDRYLALFTQEGRYLDPEIYPKKRYVTIAGVFTGVRTGKLDGTDYKYPLFEIKDIYLWPLESSFPDIPLFYRLGGTRIPGSSLF